MKTFGVFGNNKEHMLLPVECVRDFIPGGSLCRFFAFLYRNYPHIKRANDFNIQIHNALCHHLMDGKYFRLPTAFIRSEVEHDLREKITGIFKKYNCLVTEDEDDASHIIFPQKDKAEDQFV